MKIIKEKKNKDRKQMKLNVRKNSECKDSQIGTGDVHEHNTKEGKNRRIREEKGSREEKREEGREREECLRRKGGVKGIRKLRLGRGGEEREEKKGKYKTEGGMVLQVGAWAPGVKTWPFGHAFMITAALQQVELSMQCLWRTDALIMAITNCKTTADRR